MKIFNSEFEVSMRILLLLYVFNDALDEEQIIYYDFFTTYGKNYGITNENINGDSIFMLTELTSRRKLINDSIKELVLENLIKVLPTNTGFKYEINKIGVNICELMNSDYSKKYIKSATEILGFVSNKSFNEIKQFAKQKAKEVENL